MTTTQLIETINESAEPMPETHKAAPTRRRDERERSSEARLRLLRDRATAELETPA